MWSRTSRSERCRPVPARRAAGACSVWSPFCSPHSCARIVLPVSAVAARVTGADRWMAIWPCIETVRWRRPNTIMPRRTAVAAVPAVCPSLFEIRMPLRFCLPQGPQQWEEKCAACLHAMVPESVRSSAALRRIHVLEPQRHACQGYGLIVPRARDSSVSALCLAMCHSCSLN